MENEKALNNAPAEGAGNEKSGVIPAQKSIDEAEANSEEALPCSAKENNEINNTEGESAEVESAEVESVEGESVEGESVESETTEATEELAHEEADTQTEADGPELERTDDDPESTDSDTELTEIATELVSEDGTPTAIYSEDGAPLTVSEPTESAATEQATTQEAESEYDTEQDEPDGVESVEEGEEQTAQAEQAVEANEAKKTADAVVDGDGKGDNTVYNPDKPRFVDTLFEFTELFVFTLAGVLLVVTFLFRHSIVSGPSMENTLMDKDVLIISDFLYTPKVNDIVIIDTTNHKTEMEKLIVKRIIALEGQTVRIQADGVYVDGAPTSKDYEYTDGLKYSYSTEPRSIYTENKEYYNLVIGKDYYEITVPEGEIFVLGDHRNLSSDSRQNGTFDADAILGRALFRVYPNFGDPDSAR